MISFLNYKYDWAGLCVNRNFICYSVESDLAIRDTLTCVWSWIQIFLAGVLSDMQCFARSRFHTLVQKKKKDRDFVIANKLLLLITIN